MELLRFNVMDITAEAGRRPAPRWRTARPDRRARWISRAASLLGVACVGYLTLLGASLVGAPWVPRAGLPVVGAVLPRQAAPAGARLPATAAVTPAPDLHHPSATVPNTATATSGGTVSRPGQPNPTTIPSRPATTVGGAPTTTTPPATTTSLPGRSGTAPGHGRKP